MAGRLPVVVALGSVDPALVTGVFDGHCRFVPDPGDAELSLAAGAIVRADARVDQALLDKAPALRVVARTGVGVELVDVAAATARGIAVVITPGAGAAAVAEGAIGMALHLVKRFGTLTALVREGRWAQRTEVPVGDLGGAALGVVGYGRIGQRTAELGAAFGMRILAYDPVSEPPADVRCTDLGDLAGRSDVITLHLPLTEQTAVAPRTSPSGMELSERSAPTPTSSPTLTWRRSTTRSPTRCTAGGISPRSRRASTCSPRNPLPATPMRRGSSAMPPRRHR